MTPSFAPQDTTALGLAKPISFGQLFERGALGSITTKLVNLRVGKFRSTAFLALQCAMTAFLVTVSRVVGIGAKKKVRRIHAAADVTSMKHVKPVWHRAVSELPSNSMCSGVTTFKPEVAIAELVERCGPTPTVTRFVHPRPESLHVSLQ